MRKSPRVVAAAGAALLIAALLSPSMARAATVYEVQVGAFIDYPKAESTRMFPSALTVHRGDVVHFTSPVMHSVAVLTAGQDPVAWIEQNWRGTKKAWSLFVAESDEAGVHKLNPRVLFPSHPCGWPTQVACAYEGIEDPVLDVLSSGLPLFPEDGRLVATQLDFSMRVDAAVGTTMWAVSLVNPGARLRIDVVDDAVVTSDPAALATSSADQLAQDRATVRRLHNKFVDRRVFFRTASGRKVWKVWAGIETATVSLRNFYPRRSVIRSGDKVRWFFDKLRWRADTVTFPRTRGIALAGSFPQIACDPNGDLTEGSETGPTRADYPYCENPLDLEMEAPRAATARAGDNNHTRLAEFDSSGVRGPALGLADETYSLRFKKASPRRGFRYVGVVGQIIHAPMSGTVVVKKAR